MVDTCRVGLRDETRTRMIFAPNEVGDQLPYSQLFWKPEGLLFSIDAVLLKEFPD